MKLMINNFKGKFKSGEGKIILYMKVKKKITEVK